jgi:hypothetical protein
MDETSKGETFMMDDNTSYAQAHHQPPEPNLALERLDALVGEWTAEATVPSDPPLAVRGRTAFEWLTGGSFLVQRWDVAHPDFPDGIAIIGSDASAEAYRQHYFDTRGVSRVYEMSLRDNVWKLWRDSPDFSQRFTGMFSDDGKTITGRWEKSSDGWNWEHDFDLTYVKVD